MSEEIVGHIAVLDWMNNRSSLVFTTNRVIVAMIQNVYNVALGAYYLGVLGLAMADKKAKQKESEQEKLSPESILTSKKENFAIPTKPFLFIIKSPPHYIYNTKYHAKF